MSEMSKKEFKDRLSTNLSKRLLLVNGVTRDESGELLTLEVNVARVADEGVTEDGTPLNAENLNEIILSMIAEALNVKVDGDNLSIPQETREDVILPNEGSNGSSIS